MGAEAQGYPPTRGLCSVPGSGPFSDSSLETRSAELGRPPHNGPVAMPVHRGRRVDRKVWFATSRKDSDPETATGRPASKRTDAQTRRAIHRLARRQLVDAQILGRPPSRRVTVNLKRHFERNTRW